jgi:arabinose-5-phosphate isomerase
MSLSFSVQSLSSLVDHEDLMEAKRIIEIEKQGLEALMASLDNCFVHAVDFLLNTTGRVVLTGVGKSGHIAKKIASTMASTGTPAFFIHPAEASHGDLGMLTRGDSLLALSNSGETKELAEILAYAKSMHIPLIAITKNKKSTLASMAEVTLTLPNTPEACPLQLAPTTSSLMTLALGDALSMALLKRRGFTPQDFSRLHPGGRLGAKLIKVAKIMHLSSALPLVGMGTVMQEALLVMTSKSFGCIGVIDANKSLRGVITDGDLRRHMSPHLLEQRVENIMTSSPFTLNAHLLVQEAMAYLNEKNITGAFVLDERNTVCGFIHLHDCIRHLGLQ